VCRSVAFRFVAWNGARRSYGDNFVGGIERRRRRCYNKATAIVDPVDISSTVDITDAFRVAGEATADMSSCLGTWGRAAKKMDYRNFRPFCSYFGLYYHIK